jgi:hypothetical protein
MPVTRNKGAKKMRYFLVFISEPVYRLQNHNDQRNLQSATPRFDAGALCRSEWVVLRRTPLQYRLDIAGGV